MKRFHIMLACVILSSTLIHQNSAEARWKFPVKTKFRIACELKTSPLRLECKIRLDPWETLAMTAGQEGVAAFRLPDLKVCVGGANAGVVCSVDADCGGGGATCTGTALVSIDAVTMVATGTETLIAGYGPWVASAATTNAVETLSPAGAGRKWHGYRMSASSPVTAGQFADFVITARFGDNVRCDDLVSSMQADLTKAALTADGDGAGLPVDNANRGFVDLFDAICIPAVSTWGVAVLTLLVLTAATVVLIRRRSAQLA